MNTLALTSNAASALPSVAIFWGLAWALMIRRKGIKADADQVGFHFVCCWVISTALAMANVSDDAHVIVVLIVCVASVAILKSRTKPPA